MSIYENLVMQTQMNYSSPALPIIRKLAEVEKNGLVSSEFLPKCPVCGAAMDLYNAQPPKQEVQME